MRQMVRKGACGATAIAVAALFVDQASTTFTAFWLCTAFGVLAGCLTGILLAGVGQGDHVIALL